MRQPVPLCGSLSHDTVWAKSDIDLVLVTIDDSKVASGGIALHADGVNVHTLLIPRGEFRRTVEGSVQNSFMHALLAKGRLLYTHDKTIARLCEGLLELGARDREVQLVRAATEALPAVYKAHRWLITRGDLDYTVTFGRLVFGVPLRGPILVLIGLCVLGSLSFSAIGLLIASRARTIEAVSGLMNVVMLPMWVLSGVFFSAQRFPDVAQPAIKALPLTALIDALRANMLQGAGLVQIARESGTLCAWLLVCFALALKLFRWR